ncbi:hypothetical protein ACHAWF_003310 [Thalassiosira exigua]
MLHQQLLIACLLLCTVGLRTGLADGVEAESCIEGNSNADASPDALVSDLIRWLRDNGAYINEKLVVKHVVPGDPSSPRGVFAAEAMDEGENVCSIPSELMIKPSSELAEGELVEYGHCSTIRKLRDALVGGAATPYERYLLAQPKWYLPGFWSWGGMDLLKTMLLSNRTHEMTDYDELPPHGVDEFVEMDLLEGCVDIDVKDTSFWHSAMLVQARGDYAFMFADMINHDNRGYNIRHNSNYDSYVNGAVHDIVTSRVIEAGEQLFNSYNRCNICEGRFDWMGTPEMFLHYGFVESMPQSWLIDFARIKFVLDWKDGDESSGELAVDFKLPPSEKGMGLLREELARLKSFAEAHRQTRFEDYKDMTEHEWKSLWQYFDALYIALSNAVQSTSALVDDVWKLGNDWWIQDGPPNEADEAWIYPIKKGMAPDEESPNMESSDDE